MKRKAFAYTTFTITALSILMLAMLSSLNIAENPRISSENQQINNQNIIIEQTTLDYENFQKTSYKKAVDRLNETNYYGNEPLNTTYANSFGSTEKNDLTQLYNQTELGSNIDYHESYQVNTWEENINQTIGNVDQKYNASIKITGSYPKYELDNSTDPTYLIVHNQIKVEATSNAMNTQFNKEKEIETRSKIPRIN